MRRVSLKEDGSIAYSFNLAVPHLKYRYTLFMFEYGVEEFPVRLYPERDIASELGIEYQDARFRKRVVANNHGELANHLAAIFATKRCRNIIRSLMGQAEAE